MGASTAPGRRRAVPPSLSLRESLLLGSSESRHPFQPPAPLSRCGEVQELPIEGTSDATLQIASVSSDRSAQALIPLPPIRSSGREGQRTLDLQIRLVPWESKQTRGNARRGDSVQAGAIGPKRPTQPGSS